MLKKALLVIAIAVLFVCGSVAVIAARYVPVIRPNVSIGLVSVGGLTADEAAKKLRVWWQTSRSEPIAIANQGFSKPAKPFSAARLGLELDDIASVKQIPIEDFWEMVQRQAGMAEPPKKNFDPILKLVPERLDPVRAYVKANVKAGKPAAALYVDGQVVLRPETTGIALDEDKLLGAAKKSLLTSTPIEIPIKEAEKHVPDAELQKIVGVVSKFTTRFPTSKVTRCSNIKTASGKFDGFILMPGEKFSFNTVVGRRTIKNGFKIAGVYKNGKHDFDVGGGICQVSTTLYNAALLSNLKILRRSNHSLPVAYVPLGQDATVSYMQPDLVFENNKTTPIAISTYYQPGRLTMTILGIPEPDIKVKIVGKHISSWSNGVQYVNDATLKYGKQKVVDKGGTGHKVSTTKIVYRNGVEISRQNLGLSIYKGGPKIIAINKTAQPPAVTPPAIQPAGTLIRP